MLLCGFVVRKFQFLIRYYKSTNEQQMNTNKNGFNSSLGIINENESAPPFLDDEFQFLIRYYKFHARDSVLQANSVSIPH